MSEKTSAVIVNYDSIFVYFNILTYVIAFPYSLHFPQIIGSEGYLEFLSSLKRINDPRYRVSVNFLRSSLFGLPKTVFPRCLSLFEFLLPHNWLLGIFGGHFSPIVGYLEEEDMVAVFDVNHAYGLYLVSSKDLFRAVDTFDFTSSRTRALVVTEINFCRSGMFDCLDCWGENRMGVVGYPPN